MAGDIELPGRTATAAVDKHFNTYNLGPKTLKRPQRLTQGQASGQDIVDNQHRLIDMQDKSPP
jgi:hypothetical protein